MSSYFVDSMSMDILTEERLEQLRQQLAGKTFTFNTFRSGGMHAGKTEAYAVTMTRCVRCGIYNAGLVGTCTAADSRECAGRLKQRNKEARR